MMEAQKEFIHCQKCGKRLMAKLPDGSGEFMFGKSGENGKCPVVLRFWGMVELHCLSRTCDHKQTESFFPTNVKSGRS